MIDDKGWKNICETDIDKQFQDFYKGVIVACLLLLPLSVRCALVLEPETLDFGEIRYSDISEVTKKAITFNNTDQTKSVAILDSSCVCTISTDFPMPTGILMCTWVDDDVQIGDGGYDCAYI